MPPICLGSPDSRIISKLLPGYGTYFYSWREPDRIFPYRFAESRRDSLLHCTFPGEFAVRPIRGITIRQQSGI
jgi:hypothetical protein